MPRSRRGAFGRNGRTMHLNRRGSKLRIIAVTAVPVVAVAAIVGVSSWRNQGEEPAKARRVDQYQEQRNQERAWAERNGIKPGEGGYTITQGPGTNPAAAFSEQAAAAEKAAVRKAREQVAAGKVGTGAKPKPVPCPQAEKELYGTLEPALADPQGPAKVDRAMDLVGVSCDRATVERLATTVDLWHRAQRGEIPQAQPGPVPTGEGDTIDIDELLRRGR